MPPQSLDADPTSLPRQFRGYNRAATEELFRRISWEYGVLAGEHRKLKRSLDESPAPVPLPPPRRNDPDEIARAVLSAALTAARELRESAREDCERALKKARGRAARIEADADRAAADAIAVLEAAGLLRTNLRAMLDRLESGGPIPGPAPHSPPQDSTILSP